MARSLVERLRPPDEAALPPAHLGLGWAGLGPTDLPEVAGLLARCAPVDRPVRPLTPAELACVLELAGTRAGAVGGARADAVGGRDGDGRLQAAGWVLLTDRSTGPAEAFVTAAVAPSWRGRGIGRQLLTWQDGRARQLLAAQARDVPCRIGAYVDGHAEDRRRLYVAGGFSLRGTTLVLRRSTATPLTAPVPDGVRLVRSATALEGPVRAADPWGTIPSAVAPRGTEPRWSTVALAGDQVVGVVLVARRQGPGPAPEAFVERLGVLPGHPGLAEALLAATADVAAGDGAATVAVEVDRAALSRDALERLGFAPGGTRLLFTIDL